MADMTKHYVTFCSPGTLVAETTTQEIDSWDVDEAMRLADDIEERHGATPYAFTFSTRERGPDDFDSKVTTTSPGVYFLGGTVMTLAEVEALDDPDNATLISNMKCNEIDRVVVNTNSYKSVQEFTDKDVVLDYTPQQTLQERAAAATEGPPNA